MAKEEAALGNVIAPDPNWAAQTKEAALEPALPIVDPHHHLWQRTGNDYLFHDLLADTQEGHNVTATVFVDCHSMYRKDGPAELRCTGETEFANGVAAMSASGLYGNLRACAGIVSHVDLRLGTKAGPVFDAQIAAGNGRFKGIRHQTGWDADPGIRNSRTDPTSELTRDKGWREGFKELAKRKLTFDAWLYHPQIAEIAELADAFPDTTIILNHVGGPLGYAGYASRHDEARAAWKKVMVELAKRFKPWVETCIELFGADRCMFESNFPVDKITSGYGVLWNAFKRLAAGCSAAEKTALFSGNAARVYRIAL